jgi:hypothetical protein
LQNILKENIPVTSSELNNNSDFDLQKISNSTGQNTPITDVAYLEFDFVPLS